MKNPEAWMMRYGISILNMNDINFFKTFWFPEIGWFTKYFSPELINGNQSFVHGSHMILEKDVNTCHTLKKEIEFW